MRKTALWLLPLLLLAGAAFAVGFTLKGTPKTFTDCSSGGSSAQTVLAGTQFVRTGPSEGVWYCTALSAATCASGGEFLPPNFAGHINFRSDQVSVACRSALSTGDLYASPVD